MEDTENTVDNLEEKSEALKGMISDASREVSQCLVKTPALDRLCDSLRMTDAVHVLKLLVLKEEK